MSDRLTQDDLMAVQRDAVNRAEWLPPKDTVRLLRHIQAVEKDLAEVKIENERLRQFVREAINALDPEMSRRDIVTLREDAIKVREREKS